MDELTSKFALLAEDLLHEKGLSFQVDESHDDPFWNLFKVEVWDDARNRQVATWLAGFRWYHKEQIEESEIRETAASLQKTVENTCASRCLLFISCEVPKEALHYINEKQGWCLTDRNALLKRAENHAESEWSAAIAALLTSVAVPSSAETDIIANGADPSRPGREAHEG